MAKGLQRKMSHGHGKDDDWGTDVGKQHSRLTARTEETCEKQPVAQMYTVATQKHR